MDFLILILPVLGTVFFLFLFVKLINKEHHTLAGISLLGIIFGFVIVSLYYSARSSGFEASALLVETILDIIGAVILSTFISAWLPMFVFIKTIPFFEKIRNSHDSQLLPWIINIGFFSAIALIVKYFVRSVWFSNLLFGSPNNAFECVENHYLNLAAGSYQYLDAVCNIRFSLFINQLASLLGDSKPLANAMTILGGLAAIASLSIQMRTNTNKQREKDDDIIPTELDKQESFRESDYPESIFGTRMIHKDSHWHDDENEDDLDDSDKYRGNV